MANKMGSRIFGQMMDLWVKPEIERRKASGQFPDNFRLMAAQVLFEANGAIEVRLNDELRIGIQVKINSAKKKGDPIFASEIDDIVDINLDKPDADKGHLTLIRVGNTYNIVFRLLYNTEFRRSVLERAEEFLDSAKTNLSDDRLRPAIENLWSSLELGATSELLSVAVGLPRITKTHRSVSTKFHWWASLGNVDKQLAANLSKLEMERNETKYRGTDPTISKGDLFSIAESVEGFVSG